MKYWYFHGLVLIFSRFQVLFLLHCLQIWETYLPGLQKSDSVIWRQGFYRWNCHQHGTEMKIMSHMSPAALCSGESFILSFSSRWPSVEWSQRRRSHVGWFDLVHNLINPLYGSCQVQRRLCCFILQIWYNCRHSIKIDVLSQDLHRNKPVFTDIRQLLVPLKVDFCTLMQSSKTRLRYSEMLKTNISRIKSSLIAVQYF